MKRILVLALFLFLLAFGGNAWAAEPQCEGLPQYYTCYELTGQAAGAPDSVTDIGPLPYYGPNGSIAYYMKDTEQCLVVWNNPHYSWTAWAMKGTPGGTNCDQFWHSSLGIYTYWGANMPTHTGIAPVP